MQIFLLNDNVLVLDELTNAVTGAYINSATVTAQLKTATGTSVGAPLTLAYVAASNGKYRSLIEEDVAVSAGVSYEYHIDADAGSDLKAHWEVPLTAVKRTG